MNQDPPPPVSNQARRAEWFRANVRPGMSFEDACILNDQALWLIPVTLEEREQRAKDMEGMAEFVL